MSIEDLQIILQIARFRNITAAATSLGMQVATASAALKRVEAQLGTQLFIRTTRQLRLSNAGEKYLPLCEQSLNLLEQAKLNIKEDLNLVEGDIRIAVSSDFGRNILLPWLDEFMDEYPKVTVRINVSDANIDFYRDSVDMALRYGFPNDANLYGFKICNVPKLLCASEQYLKQNGRPNNLTDLLTHNGLHYQIHDVVHDEWIFTQDDKHFKIKMKGNRITNDAELVRRWCVAGKGLAAKSCLDMSQDLLTGKVVNLLPEYQLTPSELWLIFPTRQSITPAARLLRNKLQKECTQLINQLIENKILDKKFQAVNGNKES